MIDAKDLRIWNWVKYHDDDTIFKVLEIDTLGMRVEGEGQTTWIEYDCFSPIPLTPEILEKCGFEWSIYHQAWHKMGFVFDLSERHGGGFYLHEGRNNHNIICAEILFLHQLQNLYYALTKQELEYKP